MHPFAEAPSPEKSAIPTVPAYFVIIDVARSILRIILFPESAINILFPTSNAIADG